MQLRYYQEEALGSLIKHFNTKPTDHNPLLVLPTAAGKTIVFSHIIKELSAPGKRFLILAHRQELVSQAKDKLLKPKSILLRDVGSCSWAGVICGLGC